MPEQARVLPFRLRQSRGPRSGAEALVEAQTYLARTEEERHEVGRESVYGDPDILMAVCGLLRDQLNVSPGEVSAEAARIFAWVSVRPEGIGFFDERDFFLGESALLAGGATRLLGDRTSTELWLDRADAAFRHTINPAPNLARVAYIRLTLRYDMRRHNEVLEFLPSVALTFEKLGMYTELAKCWFLEAMSLKELGRTVEAAGRFQCLISAVDFRSEDAIRGMALLNLGNLHSGEGRLKEALNAYQLALPELKSAHRYAVLADLKGMMGETLRKMGQLGAAVDAYRECVNDQVGLGLRTRAAYSRVVLAEALLELGKPREAEWEVLAALPTIEEEGMAPEGFAAVTLLRESLRQRKTDPGALARVREYLQAKN
jgi:Tetratricopeptide repeat